MTDATDSLHPIDPADYIAEWYYCPICGERCVGYTSWAAHTWQVHKLRHDQFEDKFGMGKSFFGHELTWTKGKGIGNPSVRKNEV